MRRQGGGCQTGGRGITHSVTPGLDPGIHAVPRGVAVPAPRQAGGDRTPWMAGSQSRFVEDYLIARLRNRVVGRVKPGHDGHATCFARALRTRGIP
jgi:hypothetical protein